MIRLPNTGTYSLELITAQNGAQSVVSYSDATSSAYTGGTQVASITSATTTTICSTPAASTVRDVDQINIKNTFAGSHTVTVQVDANGTNYPLIVAALLTDESLNYTHGSGWQVKDANGNTKNSALSAMTSAQLAAILTDETGSGAAVFANGPTLIAPILGTPASGTVTNLTGTASININGTVGATTPAAGTFTTLTSTGNATLGDAEATDTHAIKGATTLLVNSASAALTVTQTGAGNAFVVEDSASTDGTPFVVKGDGVVISGHTTALVGQESLTPRIQQSFTGASAQVAFGQFDWSAGAVFPSHQFNKSKSGTQGSHTAGIVASGDVLGQIQWGGSDGTGFIRGALLKAEVDGTPGTNDMPGRLVLSTTADGASSPTERVRIDSSGNVGVGVTPYASGMQVYRSLTGLLYLDVQNPSVGATSDGAIVRVISGNVAGSGTSTAELVKYKSGEVRIRNSETDAVASISLVLGTTEKFRIASDGTTTLGGTSTAPALMVTPVSSQVNFLEVYGAAAGAATGLRAVGSDTNVGLYLSSKGSQSIGFYTGALTAPQVFINHTASANRYITLTGSNGGNPTIGTSAGSLAISAALVLSQTTLLATSVALTNGAAAAAGTLLNAPAAGNPTKWIPISDNGTTRYIPAW